MCIEPAQCEIFTIFDAPKLDPITVVLQDTGPNRGRVIIECYGSAWAAGWGAMGGTIRDFMLSINSGYLATKLRPIDRQMTKREEVYVQRIADAVIEAMKPADARTE